MSARTAGIKLPKATASVTPAPARTTLRGAPMPMPSAPAEDEPLAASRIASIGRSVSVKGDLTGDEDIYVEGKIDGRVELAKHHLIVGPNGEVRGEIKARQVTVVGLVEGDITVTERIEVCDTGVVDGDITTPRLLIQEGATFNGNITMVSKAPEAKRPASNMRVDRFEGAKVDDLSDVVEVEVEVSDEVPYAKSPGREDLDTTPMAVTPTGAPPRSVKTTPPPAIKATPGPKATPIASPASSGKKKS